MRLLDDPIDVNAASTEALSFIGDAVFSLLVRETLCCKGYTRSGKLHSLSAKQVSAPAQAASFQKIEPLLCEQEMAVYKRGRNAHNNNTPKNASEGEYHAATGLEALFGYLYLSGQTERLKFLFQHMQPSD